MKATLLTTVVLALGVSTGAQASLLARAGGMVYDDVNNITWAADANLFKTQAAGNVNLVKLSRLTVELFMIRVMNMIPHHIAVAIH